MIFIWVMSVWEGGKINGYLISSFDYKIERGVILGSVDGVSGIFTLSASVTECHMGVG